MCKGKDKERCPDQWHVAKHQKIGLQNPRNPPLNQELGFRVYGMEQKDSLGTLGKDRAILGLFWDKKKINLKLLFRV